MVGSLGYSFPWISQRPSTSLESVGWYLLRKLGSAAFFLGSPVVPFCIFWFGSPGYNQIVGKKGYPHYEGVAGEPSFAPYEDTVFCFLVLIFYITYC